MRYNLENYEEYEDRQYELSQRDYTDWEIEWYPDRADEWYVKYMNVEQLKEKYNGE